MQPPKAGDPAGDHALLLLGGNARAASQLALITEPATAMRQDNVPNNEAASFLVLAWPHFRWSL